MYAVQENVPIPKVVRNRPPVRRKYPFHTMTVGQMFFVPERTKNTLATHASSVGRKLGRKFLSRLTWMVQQGGAWQPCGEHEIGAVYGIAVWRTE